MEEIVLKKEVAVICWICYRAYCMCDNLIEENPTIYCKKEENQKRKEKALNEHILRLITGICISSQHLKSKYTDLFRKKGIPVKTDWEDQDFNNMLDNHPFFKKMYEKDNIYVFKYELFPHNNISRELLLSFGINDDSLTQIVDLLGLDIYEKARSKIKYLI